MLALGFSDGHSFIPVDFALFCARKAKSILCGVTKIVNSRTCEGKRRSEAHVSTIDSLVSMLDRMKKSRIQSKPCSHGFMVFHAGQAYLHVFDK